MTDPLYTRLANVAISKIAQYGRSATLRTFTNTGDAFNPTRTATDTAIILLETEFSKNDENIFVYQAGDKMFLVSSSYTPTAGAQIVDGGKAYEVVMIKTIAPGDLTVLYKVQARL